MSMTVGQLKHFLEHLGDTVSEAEIFVQTNGRADSGDHIARAVTVSLKNLGFGELGPRLVIEAGEEL